MSGARNIEQESLQEKEVRLQRELEELETAERIRDLERRIEEARRRALLTSDPGTENSPTRHHQEQASAPVPSSPCVDPAEHGRNQERAVETSRETAQEARYSQAILPDLIHSEAGLSSSLTLDHNVHTSTEILPPSLTSGLPPAKEDILSESYSITQPKPALLASSSGTGASTSHPQIPINAGTGVDPKATRLKYYHELDDSGDNDAELLFFDMDLEELYGYASALEENPENDVGQVVRLSRLFYFIFSRTSAVDDIQKAIDKAEEAVTATHIDNEDYAPYLRNLIVMLMKKYECTSSLLDIDAAILHAEIMVTVTPPLHPDKTRRLMDLIRMNFQRALQTHSPGELHGAMALAIEAKSMIQEADGDHADQYLKKFEQTHNPDDLRMAIQKSEEAIESTPRNHLNRASMLSNLAILLQFRFRWTEDLDDLQLAIQKSEEAIELTPRNHPDRAKILGVLANSLYNKFQRIGDLDDLQIAIQKSEEATELKPRDYLDRASMLSNLASFLQVRFQRTGDLDDLRVAIQKVEEAIELTPRNHLGRAGMLNNLARKLNDLQIAIQKSKEAIELIPSNRLNKAGMLNNLAIFF
ncbi:hypothetical protein F4680DRAFT_465636 [Xylaria scruposa]|nr:hypothetical protein F4680DRAFT_465636 [Xylaria scruposa]